MSFLMIGPREPLTMVHAAARASWIENHAGPYGFQRTRAQVLNVAEKNRRRLNAGQIVNARVEGIAERFALRSPANRAGLAELILIGCCAFMFPIAWPAGRALYVWLTRRVTGKPEAPLITIPIATLMAIGTALMFVFTSIFALFDVLDDISSYTVQLAGPFLIIQGAGTFLMAGIYGYLEGWLAIPDATEWWPQPAPPLTGNPSAAASSLPQRGTPGPPLSATPPVLRRPQPGRPTATKTARPGR